MDASEACKAIQGMLKENAWDSKLVDKCVPSMPPIAIEGFLHSVVGLDDSEKKVAQIKKAAARGNVDTKSQTKSQSRLEKRVPPMPAGIPRPPTRDMMARYTKAQDSGREQQQHVHKRVKALSPQPQQPEQQKPQQVAQQGAEKTQARVYGWPPKTQTALV